MRRKLLSLIWTTAVLALATSQAQAQVPPPTRVLFLDAALPGTSLVDPRYTDLVMSGLTPQFDDEIQFGDGGTATLSGSVVADIYRLRIGHDNDLADGDPVGELDYSGNGTVTVDGGAILNLVGGASGTANSALTVGNIRNGTLNIDGAGTTVNASRLVVIGTAPGQPDRAGRINITNGASLVVTAGNINLGLGSSSGQQGHLSVDGNVTMLDPSADMNIGQAKASSSFTQTSGVVVVGDNVEVGANGSGVIDPLDLDRSKFTFNISGGTFSNSNNFFVGRGESIGATFTMTGGEVTVGRPDDPETTDVNEQRGRFLMGGQTASGIVANHSGGTLNTFFDVRVGDASTGDATYNLSGTGVINSTTGGHIGRNGVGKLFQSGGIANFNGNFNIGNREGTTPTVANEGLYEISAGDLNFGASLNIASNGIGEFRVVGDDGTIDVAGDFNLNSSANGNGTLSYKLESGDSLSMINVVGTAVFTTGTNLILDDSAFSPSQTSYDLLTASFILDNGLAFDGPDSWSYEIVSGGLGQILRVNGPASVADDADFDGDGDVDGADFLTWQRGVGTSTGGTLAQGDANNDGAINGADLDVWKGQFGASTVAAAAVPEPAAGVLLLASLATAAAWRRRRGA